MQIEEIFYLVTLVIEWVMGFVSKKLNVKTDLIPYQNLIIGIIVAIIEYFITKDFKISLTVSGLFAGGVYDIFHNLKKMSWFQNMINK